MARCKTGVMLSAAKHLAEAHKILRFAQDDKAPPLLFLLCVQRVLSQAGAVLADL
jgi:hypothetical protein